MVDSCQTGQWESSLADCSSLEDLGHSFGIAFYHTKAATSTVEVGRIILTTSSFCYHPTTVDHCTLDSGIHLVHHMILCGYHYSHQVPRHGR